MSVSSIFVMITGTLIIWGGLAASIIHAVRKSKESKLGS
ncbi:MetS family NSS transporter small subunit [Cerasibacillus terrae]|uniref:MetS family NSS transporter small subunit n=1 Tax=Cerasibacillus terrae TaxID=2498845 RepID=A0A5C8NGP5_9BACI|nr:MetS family NSS transporter small subunit [Cerasibacillus terrae]TXL58131.1 MetS family NSS transporter small subunit [Cerasibacillus terrae]